MCELLGMNCNVPTDICFSFTGFQARGGLTDVHQDGWGIAFFEGKGVRQFLDPKPSAYSPVAELVRKYPIQSKNVIAHIRKATQGGVALENTHPFMRELWGYYWIFAHNGQINQFDTTHLNSDFCPVGNTDSEAVFCWILQKLRSKFGYQRPSDENLFEEIRDLSQQIGLHGEFNFLLSDGESLWVHCSTHLSYLIRQSPFSTARLKDQDVTVDFNQLTDANDRVAVIATFPLTDNETWTEMEPGTLWLFNNGNVVKKAETKAK